MPAGTMTEQGVAVPPGGVTEQDATEPLPSVVAVPDGKEPEQEEELVLMQRSNWALAGNPLPVTWVDVPAGPDDGLRDIEGRPKSAVMVPEAPTVAVVDADDVLAKVIEPDDELQPVKA